MFINLVLDHCAPATDGQVRARDLWTALGGDTGQAALDYIPTAQWSPQLLAILQQRLTAQRDALTLLSTQQDYKILLEVQQQTPPQRLARPPGQEPYTQPYSPAAAAAADTPSSTANELLQQALQQQEQLQQQLQQQQVLDLEQGQAGLPAQQPQMLQMLSAMATMQAASAAAAAARVQPQPQPAAHSYSRPILVQGKSYYPVQVLALKFWLAMDIMFGLAGPEGTQQYAKLGLPGAQGKLGFIAFADQVLRYREMFTHLEAVGLMPATEVYVRGLNEGMRQYARNMLDLPGQAGMMPRQLAAMREERHARQAASILTGNALHVYAGQPAAAGTS
uniref:Uncharacterized protein n=1 Tax=Tetradesmus obliquus TaxID=3088 RepID=A0A383WJN1_TETOB